jgi:hypothetical protein
MEFPFVDLELARRLEKVEAQSNVDFVEARAQVDPSVGAAWVEVEGTRAMFDGVDSPLTQTFCLGLFEKPTNAGMSMLEGFFDDRSAPVFHETSPLADSAALELLNARDYEPFEYTSVMFQPLEAALERLTAEASEVEVRRVGADEIETWADTSARGWAQEAPELGDFLRNLGRTSARRASGHSFLGLIDGRPIATGGLTIHDGVALFGGASTVADARRRGAQAALLEARVLFAGESGCTLLMMCALPGSASQRNAERRGFRIAYTRTKWRRRARTVQRV